MTIDEIMEFNKRYSFIACVIDFYYDESITIKNISSVDLICGFGDSGDFNESLMSESWDDLFKGKWEGDGYYSVEIVYKNICIRLILCSILRQAIKILTPLVVHGVQVTIPDVAEPSRPLQGRWRGRGWQPARPLWIS